MAYNDLAATYPTSATDYRRQQLPNTILYPGPDMAKKRPHPQETTTPIGRLLQPRPPHPYATEFMPAVGPTYTSTIHATGEPAHKKKRGRPTKAEAQQRAQEAAARGETYPPPRRRRVSNTAPPEQSPSNTDPRPHAHTPPQTGHTLPTASATPQHQVHSESGPESSSGKKRRTRPQPLELEKPHRPSSETQSPLAFGSADPHRGHTYASYTPISAPLPSSADSRERDMRMEGVEETQHRITTPHSFKDTVGI
jgi:hypothetical protein